MKVFLIDNGKWAISHYHEGKCTKRWEFPTYLMFLRAVREIADGKAKL